HELVTARFHGPAQLSQSRVRCGDVWAVGHGSHTPAGCRGLSISGANQFRRCDDNSARRICAFCAGKVPGAARKASTLRNGKRADTIDLRIMLELSKHPRATTVAIANEVGIARNPAQARLGQLERNGSLTAFER